MPHIIYIKYKIWIQRIGARAYTNKFKFIANIKMGLQDRTQSRLGLDIRVYSLLGCKLN